MTSNLFNELFLRMEGWFIANEPDDNVSLTRLGMELSIKPGIRPQPRIYGQNRVSLDIEIISNSSDSTKRTIYNQIRSKTRQFRKYIRLKNSRIV